jgi:Skp family chaperone for outer membrane proteins
MLVMFSWMLLTYYTAEGMLYSQPQPRSFGHHHHSNVQEPWFKTVAEVFNDPSSAPSVTLSALKISFNNGERLKRDSEDPTPWPVSDSVEVIKEEFAKLKAEMQESKKKFEDAVYGLSPDDMGMDAAMGRGRAIKEYAETQVREFAKSAELLRRLCRVTAKQSEGVALAESAVSSDVVAADSVHPTDVAVTLLDVLEPSSRPGNPADSIEPDEQLPSKRVKRVKRGMDYFKYFTTGGGVQLSEDMPTVDRKPMNPYMENDMNRVRWHMRFKTPPPPDYYEFAPPDESPLLTSNQTCFIGAIIFVIVGGFATAMALCKPEEPPKEKKEKKKKQKPKMFTDAEEEAAGGEDTEKDASDAESADMVE